MPYGTLIRKDTTRSAYPNVLDYGEDRLYEDIARKLNAHNQITDEMLTPLVEFTTERIGGFGGSSGAIQERFGEHGVPAPSKSTPGGQVGFPLWREGQSLQWTRDWLQTHSPDDMMAQVDGQQLADNQAIQKALKEAIFFAANYTFNDDLVDGTELFIKRLANADGMQIPTGPNGETFNAGSHTHYLATASLIADNIEALLVTVREHFTTGTLVLMINSAQEAAIRAMTGEDEFVRTLPAVLESPTDAISARATLDTNNLYNRVIGYFGTMAAPVWVKPWIPANYMLAMLIGGGDKPLAFRHRGGGMGNLSLMAQWDSYPLRADSIRREYGIAVKNRVAAAALYIGGGAYVNPTL